MDRLSLWLSLGSLIFAFVSCTSQNVAFDPEALSKRDYQTVYIQPEGKDPLQLNSLVREEIQEQGYQTLSGDSVESDKESWTLIYDYETALDLGEEGLVSRRLQWFKVRLEDNSDRSVVASGEVHSGLLTEPSREEIAELIAALTEQLQSERPSAESGMKKNDADHGKRKDREVAGLRDGKSSAGVGEKSSSEAEGKNEIPEPDPGPVVKDRSEEEKVKNPNPWIPRFKSWGFEDWEKED